MQVCPVLALLCRQPPVLPLPGKGPCRCQGASSLLQVWGEHNAPPRVCPARPRPCRDPHTASSPACTLEWSSVLALPLTTTPGQAVLHHGQPSLPCLCQLPRPQPSHLRPAHRPLTHTAPPSASGAASHQAGGPAGAPTPRADEAPTVQDTFNLLTEINDTLTASNARAAARSKGVLPQLAMTTT